MTKIRRVNRGYRPLFIDGELCLSNIIIYNNGKVLYESGRGWIESYNKNEDVIEINLKHDISRSTKPILTKKKNFYAGNKDNGYTLYINADIESIEFGVPTWIRDFETDTRIGYTKVVDILFKSDIILGRSGVTRKIQVATEHEFRDTIFGKRVKSLYESFRQDRINISLYDTEKLLAKYIVKRRVEVDKQ